MAENDKTMRPPVNLILTNLRENHAEKGIDWIVMWANGLAVTVVLLAAASENPFDFAEDSAAPEAFEVALLD